MSMSDMTLLTTVFLHAKLHAKLHANLHAQPHANVHDWSVNSPGCFTQVCIGSCRVYAI